MGDEQSSGLGPGGDVKIASLRTAPTVIVASGSEGEPLSAKDAVLLRASPHLVLDGLALLGDALAPRADLVVMAGPGSEASVSAALAERGDRRRFTVRVAEDRFVSGESTAVAAALAGKEQIPQDTVHHLTDRGLRGKPLLLQNVETLAHVALIARFGAGWFRGLGTPDDPGTRLITLGRPEGPEKVLEVPGGATLGLVLGGAGVDPTATAGVLVGGYHGAWVTPVRYAQPLAATAGPGRIGAGAGVLMVLDQDRCPLAVTAAILDYLAAESAGQCGPCVLGLPRIAQEMHAIAAGRGDTARLRQRLDAVVGSGACHHPDGTARLAASTLETFGAEVAAHAAGRCTGGVR
ncbi:NADH-ubiquinone oxidoreductase-F iron-sulfur binding region domain-containing protein [Nigerium massiliense]|uniref:NADH-ubiquinone oxidoreductase-F iron-sulfur binding region domain-containing protein n=1 Tax=Nigerium massiliense TaxID=1522317 RepID=UPI00069448CB|nr:NADH-ubiquinone oxidoreductase-F iron-sulfur binding region domain-containing protein [Nigerium massiliense]